MKKDEKNFRKFRKGPILVAALFLLLSGATFSYELKKINRNKIVAAETLQVWETEESRRNEIKSLHIFLRNLEKERTALDLHFGQSSNIVPFLDSLEDLSRQAGAEPEILSVETARDGSGLLVSLRAEGSFESVYKLLELLENSAYELEFEALDIGRTGGGGAAGWEGLFKLKLLTFIP